MALVVDSVVGVTAWLVGGGRGDSWGCGVGGGGYQWFSRPQSLRSTPGPLYTCSSALHIPASTLALLCMYKSVHMTYFIVLTKPFSHIRNVTAAEEGFSEENPETYLMDRPWFQYGSRSGSIILVNAGSELMNQQF